MEMLNKVYANGRGGKHRHGDPEAEAWRNTTAQVARYLRAAYPKMCATVVQVRAEDETASDFRNVNRRYNVTY